MSNQYDALLQKIESLLGFRYVASMEWPASRGIVECVNTEGEQSVSFDVLAKLNAEICPKAIEVSMIERGIDADIEGEDEARLRIYITL